jgi:hypothetical protein
VFSSLPIKHLNIVTVFIGAFAGLPGTHHLLQFHRHLFKPHAVLLFSRFRLLSSVMPPLDKSEFCLLDTEELLKYI